MSKPKISVVVPCYNEEHVLPILKKELNEVFCTLKSGYSFEVLYIDEDTLITGAVNPGAIIYLKARLYILKEVYGTIEGIHETAQIYSKYFKNATIRFFGKSIHNFTSFTMSVLYYKDNEIVCDKEESVNV